MRRYDGRRRPLTRRPPSLGGLLLGALALSPLTLACGEKDSGDSGGVDSAAEVDGDGDGFMASEDCDDADPDISPGAEERCDEVDNDCDGEVDEGEALGASTFYADVDADGYGDPTATILACDAAPEGYTADSSDCDDSSASVFPGAEELCDGIDSDCDGVVGEARVPTDYPAVQDAIDAGEPFICMEAGRYTEQLVADLNGPLVLAGVGSGLVTLDGDGAGRALDVNLGAQSLTLMGFTVVDGVAEGGAGGISAVGEPGSTLRVEDLAFTGNACTAGNCYGAALGVSNVDRAELIGVVSHDNTLSGVAHGSLSFVGVREVVLEDVEIFDELADAQQTSSAVALLVQGRSTDSDGVHDSTVVASGLYVHDNVGTSSGVLQSAVTFTQLGAVELSSSRFINNRVTATSHCYVPGFWSYFVKDGDYQNIEVVGNRCEAGGLIYATGFWHYGLGSDLSEVHVDNAIIAGNSGQTTSQALAGVVLEIDAISSWTNVTVHGNAALGASVPGGWRLFRDAQSALRNVVYSGNELEATGDGAPVVAFASADSSLSFSWRYSDLVDLGDAPFSSHLSDPRGADGNISVDPGYSYVGGAAPEAWNLSLDQGSALIDAGDANLLDPDGTVSDIGAFGGPGANDW